MDAYTILARIGEGAHGVVFRAKHIQTGQVLALQTNPDQPQVLALKKVLIRRLEDGIPNTALREIKALQHVGDHENIVKFYDVSSFCSGCADGRNRCFPMETALY